MNRSTPLKATLSGVAALAACIAAPVAAQDLDIVNATVATGDGGEPMPNMTVSVRAGNVVYVGPDSGAPAREANSAIDGTGRWVSPGIFMPVTDLGLWDVGAVTQSNDIRAGGSRFDAALDAATAINPASQHIAVSRAGGVTRASVVTSHAGSIFAGQGTIIDTGADTDAVVRPRAFQWVALGEAGARLAGGSRVAAFAELANAMREAQAFAAGTWEGEEALLTRADAAALAPVLRGEQALYVHAERASDIRAVLGLKQTYPKIDLVLVSASEGWLVANEIAAAGVPVIADPLDNLPSSFEQIAATQSNIGRMVQAGVTVAIGGLSGGITAPRKAPQMAGNLVALSRVPRATGLSWGQAFATITSVPAAISGYAGRYGVLAPGAAGDVVLWDGDPLELSSAPVQVFIDGVDQPLDSHQTRLRDRYRDLDESDLPKAYDW